MLGISTTSSSRSTSSTNAVIMSKTTSSSSHPPNNNNLSGKKQSKLLKRKNKKKSSLHIKIKPFTKPPSLPPNFYDTSTSTLYSSLRDILHQRTNSHGGSAISREELYHKVTDLCSHGYGPRLYLELVHVLNDAAATCVLRLVDDGTTTTSMTNPTNGTTTTTTSNTPTTATMLKYPIAQCTAKVHPTDKSTLVYFTSMKELHLEPESFDSVLPNTSTMTNVSSVIGSSTLSNDDFTLLGNIWKMYSDYVQYLNCVRLIFQSLDRMYVYVPPTFTTTTVSSLVTTTAKATTPVAAATTTTTTTSSSSSPMRQAQILPRNDTMVTTSTTNSDNGIISSPWNMWDVGMNCLYNHMSLLQKKDSIDTNDDSVMEDCTSTAAVASIESNSMDPLHHMQQYSILTTLKQRTIARLIEELRNTSPARPSSFLLQRSSSSMHQLIVRQCISIFRSLSHVSMHQTNAIHSKKGSKETCGKFDIMQDFLSDLVSAMTTFFSKESQSYMALLNDPSSSSSSSSTANRGRAGGVAGTAFATTTTTANKTRYDARAILHHINSRLKQVKSMTSYYSLSNTNLNSSLYDSKNTSSTSGTNHTNHYPTTSTTTTTSTSKNDNQILSQLVETEFLAPHFSTNRLLHPTNLHPIFDDEFDGSVGDVKLLFQLSKRVHSTNDGMPGLPKDFSIVPHSAGMELLRTSFERYGIESGLSIVRPNMNPNHTKNANVAASGVGGAVKPPPPMTSRDIQNKIVSNLLKFKSHLEFLLKEAFSSEESFGKTLKKILEDVLNQGGEVSSNYTNQSVLSTTDRRKKGSYRHSDDGCDGGKRIAELLAKFIDLRFRNAKVRIASSPMRGMRGSDSALNGDNDMESFMDASLDLFRHIQSKDVFEAFYRRDLSRRLLTNKSASIDVERSFVSKLKSECGTGYTSKMEGMFKDMDLSRDVMSNYSSHVGSLADVSAGTFNSIAKSNVDMDIQVLTTGYWPVQNKLADLALPETLQAKKDHFESYYLSKYQGRRIAWQNSLGNCIVKAQFPKMSGPRELNVSLCQALVLMCFNVSEGSDEDPRYTINDIMEKTGIDDRGEAERVLQSLSMGRDGTQVLQRVEEKRMSRDADGTSTTPKKKHKVTRRSIADTDVFMFNSNFLSNQKRIRITNIQMKETAEERSKTQEAVTLDRLYLVDAAIVRIMKARKTLDHRTLVGEAMKQLKFPAKNTDIKKRIETLIEREYLERIENAPNNYNYLA